MLPHGLLEDAGQAIPLALLNLEVALRPVMQHPTKPTLPQPVPSRLLIFVTLSSSPSALLSPL